MGAEAVRAVSDPGAIYQIFFIRQTASLRNSPTFAILSHCFRFHGRGRRGYPRPGAVMCFSCKGKFKMFKFLRSQAKVFYWVIAGSFVLFLALGGLTSRGCQAPGTHRYEPGVVGKVNGMKLMAADYDNAVRNQIAFLKRQSPDNELTADQLAIARQRAWDALVQDALVQQAIAKHKIKVSDQEVLDVLEHNPPQELLANFRDENGKVDMQAYYAALQNPDNDWSQTEQYIRTYVLPRQKLNDLVTADVSVSEDEVRTEYIRQTARAVAEYMGVLFQDLDLPTPGDDEIQAWYQEHIDDYQAPEKATCTWARFPKTPSDADYADVRSYILEIRDKIESGELTFEEAAKEYSEDGTAANGGDLGTFDRNRMVKPFTDAAFSLPVGEISQPVRTRFGYHLIQVLEQVTDGEGNVDQVHARHILMKVTPGPTTLDEVHAMARDFADSVTAADFTARAQADSIEFGVSDPFPSGRDIPGLPLSMEGAYWVFSVEPGTISPVFENNDCYYVVLAGDRIPAGPESLENVRGRVLADLNTARNTDAAREKLNPAVGEVQMGTAMAEVAAKHDLKYAVTDTFTVNANVPDVGYGTDFNLKVITGQVGQLIPEIQTQRGLFAATPLWISPFDEADYQQRRDGIMAYLRSQAQAEAVQAWMDAQKAAAKIEDYRYAGLSR